MAAATYTPPRTPPEPLPKPAEVLLLDFRPPAGERPVPPKDRPIKLLQWNIERGYKLDAIIAELRALDADVLALQEIDIHCERSGWVDTGRAIAQALGLAYAFVAEFEEIHSPLRAADAQGGGVHGNAILSKYDIIEARCVEHTTHPIDWELPPPQQPHKLAAREPRKGRRVTTAATIATPQGPLLVYSAHLECFCGALARMAQLSDLFRDTRQQAERAGGAGGPPKPLAAALMGDLNTLANGVARLSPHYCNDHLRWASLGWFEAELLDHRVLRVTDPAPLNEWARRQGLPEAVCRDLVNPGYSDPWDSRHDITFDHVKYRYLGQRLMTGKLDWVLLRHAAVVSRAMGNQEYTASDHKWLAVEVNLEQGGTAEGGGKEAEGKGAEGEKAEGEKAEAE
ncbi:hypothetical protein HYH03_017198 [Edaphochlamys debaryana]|uniref:Endonuclease/exonuclease/phosphatase domain-containing protein n=1 Tax=Edaphochlamys debaryana TaxID=47281 RepID=A0A835XIV0_9CHLO|nr:hypothetical protein HYH03_017198 [Edaphochlamys debaryana]|eukprot:KAG2483952.1 hypothetical protein HYH03_017198 [Edaphochlamys debaryana]